jgi:hypothetical protein
MRPVIALLVLGSIVTSASAAGTDIHGFVDAQTGHTVMSEQQSTQGQRVSGGTFSRYGNWGRGAAGFGHW